MIPKHVQGKSASQIMVEMKQAFPGTAEDWTQYLEILVMLAIKDALVNADEAVPTALPFGSVWGYKGEMAEGLAMAYLNSVCPMKKSE